VNTTVSGCNGSNSSTVYYHYDAAGDVSTERFPGSVQSAVASDNADRLMSVTNTVGGNPLSSYSFGSRDGDGNPTSLITASTTTYYGYDQLDRLTGVCSSSPCDPLNHLSTITGAVYGYDNVGNRTSLSQYSSGTQTSTSSYLYNADDQLCWFTPGTSTNACNSTPSGGTNYYPFTANGDEGVAGSWTYHV